MENTQVVVEEILSPQSAIAVILSSFLAVVLFYLFYVEPKMAKDSLVKYSIRLPPGRRVFQFVTEHQPDPDTATPNEIYAWKKNKIASLLRWAVTTLEMYEIVARDHFEHQKMYKSGFLDEEMWHSVDHAKKVVEMELETIREESGFLGEQAKQTIFKEAGQILARLRQFKSMRMKAMEAHKAEMAKKAKEESSQKQSKVDEEKKAEEMAKALIEEEEKEAKKKQAK